MGEPPPKRVRLRAKTTDVAGAYSAAVPLPHMLPRVETSRSVSDGRSEPGVWPRTKNKVKTWFNHPAALTSQFPLSAPAKDILVSCPGVEADPTVRETRSLLGKLDVRLGHSFEYNDEWFSLNANEIATFYEDRVLHMIGRQRIAEWWASQPESVFSHAATKTGAAVTFWYSMDNSPRLPDAIEVGLASTLLAQFEQVFCLTYQPFENMPPHITVVDCGKILPENEFAQVLDSMKGVCGFVAVLAEWIKQVAALELDELRPFAAVTTFDGDSLWQRRCVPPRLFSGHAAGTLQVNQVSHENVNKPKRLIKLSYRYCQKPRDFLKIATPMRWPRQSPALRSLVIRIRPFVRSSSWSWCGGSNFETIMDVMWDTYNVWGLREGFNDYHVYTLVPWFAREQPLQEGSAENPRWGMATIQATPTVVCVNGMWQSSAGASGPKARCRLAWARGSLVSSLVFDTIARCRQAGAPLCKKGSASWLTNDAIGVFLVNASVTPAEEDAYVQVLSCWFPNSNNSDHQVFTNYVF